MPYICQLCGKEFNFRSLFKTHSYLHIQMKCEKTDIIAILHQKKACKKKTSSKKNQLCRKVQLKCHQKVPTKKISIHQKLKPYERPFSCDICQKFFKCKKDRNKHQKNHTGEKPFACNMCPKTFRTKCLFEKHYTVHTGEKRYICELCNKPFRELEVLKRHYRVHTGERPYHCDQCPQKFKQHYQLKVHYRLHTNEKPYACNMCSESFYLNVRLKRHKSQCHADAKEIELNTFSNRKIFNDI